MINTRGHSVHHRDALCNVMWIFLKNNGGLNTAHHWILLLITIAAIILAVAQVGAAAIITVDDSGGADFTMIQDAIDAASPGDTIEVYSGTYYENVNVTKQLTLQGVDTGMDQPVVDAGESGSAIALSVDGTVLEGFTAVNSGNYWSGAGITVISKNNTISSNNLSSNSKGIYLLHSSNNTITGNIASENKETGIYIEDSSNNTIKDNIVSENEWTGIYLEEADNNTVTSNLASNNNGYGITLGHSSNNILRNNHMFDNRYNFGVEGWNDKDFDNDIDMSNLVDEKLIYYLLDTSNTVIDSASNAGTVYCINCDNVTVKYLTLTNNQAGIYCYNSSSLMMQNNTISNNDIGINLAFSNNSSIMNNNASNNEWSGIMLDWDSHNNSLINNVADNNVFGISLEYHSSNNSIINNSAGFNELAGIEILGSNHTITGNNVTNNAWYGMLIVDSSNNTLRNNRMSDNWYNFGLESWQDVYFNHDIDTSNVVDGKPMYYLVGASGTIIDQTSNAGIIYCIHCDNVTVQDLNLTNNSEGVYFFDTHRSTIQGNHITNNERGIRLKQSSNNSITMNNASDNKGDGIGIVIQDSNRNVITGNNASSNNFGMSIGSSHNNIIDDNNVSNNRWTGIELWDSGNNSFTRNTVINNFDKGISLRYCRNNTLYHNTFANNTQNGFDESSENFWDAGYPAGGNTWDDYMGVDSYSGPHQDQPGNDGIGDTPYNMSGGAGAQDRYPMIGALAITSFSPAPSVTDIIGATRTFNFTINQTANVTWYLDEEKIQFNESVTHAAYTTTDAPLGIWTIKAIAANPNGTVMLKWTWNVEAEINTPAGTNVELGFIDEGVNVTFAKVIQSGQTSVDVTTAGPSPPLGFKLPENYYYDITTTANYAENVSVCIHYNDTPVSNEPALKLFHYENVGYEFLSYVQQDIDDSDTTWDLTSATHPDIMYYDFDEGVGKESLHFVINGQTREINGSNDNFVYHTSIYYKDSEPFIAWLGEQFYVIENGSTWYISKVLVDEDEEDDHLLRTGENLSLPGGFVITPLEIDVDLEEVWFIVTKDGEEVESLVIDQGEVFEYETDLNESGEDDNWVLRFNVDTLFAGMWTNLVKINNVKLISPEVTKIETPDDDTLTNFEITSKHNDNTLEIRLEDSNETISLKKDGTVSLLNDRFNVRINKDGDIGAVVGKITEPGTHELFAEVQDNITIHDTVWDLTSATHPNLLYYDLEEGAGSERLHIEIDRPFREINGYDNNFVYNTSIYTKQGEPFIAWLGEPYYVVENGSIWYLSKVLVDEDENDIYLLGAGESLNLPEDVAIILNEVDVEGRKAWFSVTENGDEVESMVVEEGETFVYETDLNESGYDDNWLLKFNLKSTFADMNTSMVTINAIKFVSSDVIEIDTPDDKTFDKFVIESKNNDNTLEVRFENPDDVIILEKGGIVGFLNDMFHIRINKDGDVGGLLKVVEIGGEVPPTATGRVTGTWVDVTTSLDSNENVICGTVPRLSEFVVAEPIVSTPPVINSVILNTTTPEYGGDILVTVNATHETAIISVEANGTALEYQGGDIWKGTITALEGTHSVNVSAIDVAGSVGWNTSASYTATIIDTKPPVLPMGLYGNVTINGEPAPDGTTILAKIDDEIRGTAIVKEGKYGQPAYNRLIVNGNTKDDGKIIRFYTGSTVANETITWHSGDVKPLDLSFTTIAGIWQGTLTVSDTQLSIVFNISTMPDGTYAATMDSPDQAVSNIPVDEVIIKNNTVLLEVTSIAQT